MHEATWPHGKKQSRGDKNKLQSGAISTVDKSSTIQYTLLALVRNL